jgi:hypothetical protein
VRAGVPPVRNPLVLTVLRSMTDHKSLLSYRLGRAIGSIGRLWRRDRGV